MSAPRSPADGTPGPASRALAARAAERIPGGVNSPVRAFRSVGEPPLFLEAAEGPYVRTADGAWLVDYIGSWGPAILGHAHPKVVEAVCAAAGSGLSFGASTAAEVDLAERLCRLHPALEDGMVRLVNSGTEATMSAIRLARGATGRSKIVKMDGGYHGHADALLAAAGSGAATLGIPGSAGVPAGAVADTVVVPYNDLAAVAAAFEAHGDDLAAVIVEPVAGNMGCIPPVPGYLEGLRALCDDHGALLVFDEVMTGFRLALGGASERFGVRPDLVCLGKIAGGGMPLGAYGGRREILAKLAPEGPVYQAGTLSGNPLAVAAGRATLEILEADPPYARLRETTAALVAGIEAAAREAGVPVTVQACESMWTVFFTDRPVRDYAGAKATDTAAFARFHAGMLARGVLLPPSAFEACFVSAAHDEATIAHTLEAARAVFADLSA